MSKTYNMFSYGIFTDEGTRREVFRRELKTRSPAILRNYQRIGNLNFIRQWAGGKVEGVLIEGLDEDDVKALDYIEVGYIRGSGPVEVGDETVEAIFYYVDR